MATETMACGHTDCQCMVTAEMDAEGTDALPAYCSDYCRNSEEGHERFESQCACGHPPCDEP